MREIFADLVVRTDGQLLECPLWLDSGTLCFVDIPSGRLFRLEDSVHMSIASIGQPTGAVIAGSNSELWLAVRDGIGRWDSSGFTLVAPIELDIADNQMNDAQTDPAGRIWAGTTAVDETPGAGALYRIDPNFNVTRVMSGSTISNGIGWSPDARSMYYIDSPTRSVTRFRYDLAAGTPSDPRLLVQLGDEDGLPDGMAVDRDGRLWVACWGGGSIRCFSPDGALEAIVRVPTPNVTSCVFGGADYTTLFITTAADPESGTGAALYRCTPGATGRPATRFGGGATTAADTPSRSEARRSRNV